MYENQLAEVTAAYLSAGRVVVDVTTDRPGDSKTGIPYLQLAPGLSVTPAQGDMVLLMRLNEGSYVALSPVEGSPQTPIDLTENELHFQWADGTRIAVRKDPLLIKNDADEFVYEVFIESNGPVNITATGDLSATSLTGNVDVTSSQGDVNIDAPSGDVLIDGIDFDSHDHSFSVSGTTSNGGTFSDSGTTSGPN
jgi:hypothetical protein